jgi:hypothetical protein
MAPRTLKNRVAVLETQVADLKSRLEKVGPQDTSWVNQIWGTFANDPMYEEAMRLGRQYRESLRPKNRKRRKK